MTFTAFCGSKCVSERTGLPAVDYVTALRERRRRRVLNPRCRH